MEHPGNLIARITQDRSQEKNQIQVEDELELIMIFMSLDKQREQECRKKGAQDTTEGIPHLDYKKGRRDREVKDRRMQDHKNQSKPFERVAMIKM